MSLNFSYSLNLRGNLIDLSTPQVMAVLNLSPDSFYDKSRLISEKSILTYIENAISEGVSIIDIGAYSTRPSAKNIPETDEIERLKYPLELIRKRFHNIILSVDTFRANVARYVVENFDVQIINDVSGGTMDNAMFTTIAKLNVAYVLMHMKGTPETMQNLTNYENMMSDIMHFFEKRIAQLLLLDIKDIIIDPGFGFAKTLDQNYELLSKMSYLQEFGFPIMAGVSRKSMIYKLLETSPEKALNGTSVLNTIALLNGANILRVHDVKETVETIKIVQKYLSQN